MADSARPPTDPAPTPEPDLSGRQLGDYRLLRRLGRGAMAEVYLAEQGSLRRLVAFKVLKRSLADDESYVKRFHNEAHAAASLVHANIVQIHEVGCLDGAHFIAQEYVQGQNLAQLISRHGPVEVGLAVSIMRQVSAALQKAGQHGIIHRDIKPENIMLAATGEVKVADFGLARIAGDGVAANLTQVGVTMGTPLYMSPEQAEGKSLKPPSDIYSFGVTCYHMIAGRPPFEGDTALSVAVQHLKSAPEPLENLRRDLPADLCRIVHKMLAKEPHDRYPWAADLLQDLRSIEMEGAEGDWLATSEQLGATDSVALAETRTAATQRLATLMETTSIETPRRWWSRRLAVGLVVAPLIGAAIAWLTRDAPLLDVTSGQRDSPVERKETPAEQYIHAAILNNDPDAEGQREQAWESVWKNFPDDTSETKRYYELRAKQQLARLYVDREQLDLAMEIYAELARLDPEEKQFRAFGLAGQAHIYSRRDEQGLLVEKMTAVWPLLDELSPETQEDVKRLMESLEAGVQQAIKSTGQPDPAAGQP